MKKKVFKIIRNTVIVCLAFYVAAFLLAALLHATYFRNKYEQIQPYGEMIPVFDGQMHISQSGEGDTTIVLLPGLGEGLPSADFAPLIRELSKDYHVVCVDYFGVGFSTETERERTCENYAEEIREVLHNAGIEGPYVLMPHSISGLYCEYFACSYPEEVKAIISLDGSPSTYPQDIPAFLKTVMSAAYRVLEFTGAEVNTLVQTNTAQMVNAYGYTEKEVEDYLIFSGFMVNDNLIETSANTDLLIREVMDLELPEGILCYKFISGDVYDKNVGNMTGEQIQLDHLAHIGAEDSWCVLEGSHFIYREHWEEIAGITREFLAGME